MLTGDHIDLLITAPLRWRVRTNVTTAAFTQVPRGSDYGPARHPAQAYARALPPPARAMDTGAVVRDEVLQALAGSYLFEGLTTEDLRPLAAVSTTRRLTRGEAIIRVDDQADEIYIVLSGELKDSVVDADGVEVVHFLHGPGMTFGEPGYFAIDHQRIVEVLATEPTVVIRLGRRELAPFMAQHPTTKDRALEELASNQRWQTTMISSLATKPLVDRLVL